jgi:hypothetical protein
VLRKEDVSNQLEQEFEREKPLLEKTFWSPDRKIYSYAVDSNNTRIDIPSVLAAVPMWFGLLDEDHSRRMNEEIAGPDHQADWGMRILSSHDPKYDPGGYHFGVVWPLFTGWASVGEYRYHQALPAYSNLRTNALLVFDGSLGHVTEVLSGKYYQTLSTGSPHQTWSAAMVVAPMLKGLLGLQADATGCHLEFAPHVPADWNSFSINNVRLGSTSLKLDYQRTADSIRLEVQPGGETGKCSLEFSPAVSLRAKINRVRLNGQSLPFHLQANSSDQHITMNLPLTAIRSTIEIQLSDDFQLSESFDLPALGSTSHGLRVLSETWSAAKDSLTVQLAGAAAESYELSAWNAGQIRSVEGAELTKETSQEAKVRVKLPPDASGESKSTVVFHMISR